jgi:hypothetical protein
MCLPDAPDRLRALRGLLKPGALMRFHEHDMTMAPASPAALPLHRRAQG